MRTLPIVAVMQNGAEPDDDTDATAPYAQDIAVPRWTDCQLNVTCVDTAGEPFDITGGALLLSAKARPDQDDPDLSLEATITDADDGEAYFVIGSVNSGALTAKSYGYVIVYVDSDGYIWPVVAEGRLAITPSDYVPGQDVTVPDSQQPLAQGPPGLTTFTARTVGATTDEVVVYTMTANSAGLLRLEIGCTSDSFAQGGYFETISYLRMPASGDGSQQSYTLIRSATSSGFEALAVSIGNTLTDGDVTLTVTGIAGRTVDWTIKALDSIAIVDQ